MAAFYGVPFWKMQHLATEADDTHDSTLSLAGVHLGDRDVPSSLAEHGSEEERAKITDVQVVTAYSWLKGEPSNEEAPNQTMAIPGTPALFTSRSDSPFLEPDTTSRYLDENAARYPDSPFEPGIRAVLHQQPSFDFTDLELITDRYALIRLLELATGGNREDFNFGAQIIGNTVMFIRSDSAEHANQSTICGYRESFEKAYLQYEPELKATSKHYRIITYKFGAMKIMLRHAADAYLPPAQGDLIDLTDLSDSQFGNVTIRSTGTLVSQASVTEFMTLNAKHKLDHRIRQKLCEAWLSQTHQFAVVKYALVYTGPKKYKAPGPRKAHFPQSGTDIYSKKEITEAVHPIAVEKFYEMLKGLLQDIRSQAAGREEWGGLVSYKRGEEGLHPLTAHDDLPGLSKELRDRLKTPQNAMASRT